MGYISFTRKLYELTPWEHFTLVLLFILLVFSISIIIDNIRIFVSKAFFRISKWAWSFINIKLDFVNSSKEFLYLNRRVDIK